jgi:serine/threonine protein kinase
MSYYSNNEENMLFRPITLPAFTLKKAEKKSDSNMDLPTKPSSSYWQDEIYIIPKNALPLAEGGFGRVYRAFGQKDSVIVKVFKKPESKQEAEYLDRIIKNEIAILQRYDSRATTLEDKDTQTTYIVSSFMPGQELFYLFEDGSIQKLSFEDQIHLVWQLALQINLLHHNTVATGPAIIHKDITVSNIMIDIESRQLSVIDFGLSEVLGHDNPDKLWPSSKSGSESTRSPEVETQRKAGLKSDIFAIASIIMLILGFNPYYRDKDRPSPNKFKLYQLNYLTLPKGYPAKAKDLLIKFITHLGSQTYSERYNSDELLQFFTTFRLLNLLVKENNKTAITKVVAKLDAIVNKTYIQPTFNNLLLNAFQQFKMGKDNSWLGWRWATMSVETKKIIEDLGIFEIKGQVIIKTIIPLKERILMAKKYIEKNPKNSFAKHLQKAMEAYDNAVLNDQEESPRSHLTLGLRRK